MRAIDLVGAARADQLAIAQHRHAVADLEHLAKPVRDVDDRLAFGLQRTQCAEDAFDLDVGQRRGRLVEDEDARVARQHPRKLDKLAPADAELRHRRLQRQIAQPDLLERRARPVAKFLAAVKQRHLAVAEPDVVEHRQRRREAQLLRHQRDAKLLRVLRIADLDRLAINAERRPASAECTPVMIFTSVLLPAPFSPQIARISCASSATRDVLENLVRAEPLRYPFNRENGHRDA